MEIPRDVLRSFGLNGPQQALPGGTGRSVLVDGHVLKPVDNLLFTEWATGIWCDLKPEAYRTSKPLKSDKGTYVSDGWVAAVFEEGEHKKGFPEEKLRVCRALHADLRQFQLSGIPDNTGPWARAHRIAWQIDKMPADFPYSAQKRFQTLLQSAPQRDMQDPQIIHADLCGNILFSESDAPLVIDFSPCFAPSAYAEAILVSDSIAWESSPLSLISLLTDQPQSREMLIRAIVFRLSVSVILDRDPGFEKEWRNFEPLMRHLQLIGA